MKCVSASPASDMWSTGVIIFMMVTGGYSPFYSSNQVKMQRRALRGNYDIEQFTGVSQEAKNMIRGLLVVDPTSRLTADQCLQQQWASNRSYINLNVVFADCQVVEWCCSRRWQCCEETGDGGNEEMVGEEKVAESVSHDQGDDTTESSGNILWWRGTWILLQRRRNMALIFLIKWISPCLMPSKL